MEIDEFVFDEHNISEMARHGVTYIEAIQVIEGEYHVLRNRTRHVASQSLIIQGRTFGGRVLHIPIQATSDPRIWRPATAYDPSNSQFRR